MLSRPCQQRILDLPNEILVKIFLVYRSSHRTKSDPWNHRPRRQRACQWAELMRVCRHWRDVALASPTLWQVVDVDKNTSWLKLALERSRGAALELYFHERITVLDTIPILISEAHRLRKLFLPRLVRTDLLALAPLFDTPMPVLSELKVYIEEPHDVSASATIHFHLSAASRPCLRSIRLPCMVVPWSPESISRMRYLHLRECTALDAGLTFDQFLDSLASCTELEELRIHRFVSTISHRVPANFDRTIVLPRLRKLTIGDTPALCGKVLSAIQLPANITLRVVGWIDDNLEARHARRLFLSMIPENKRTLLALMRTLKQARVDFTFTPLIQARGDSGSMILKLRWDVDMDDYTERALAEFGSIFEDVPLEDLHINCTPHTVPNLVPWVRLFVSFPRLHTLSVLPGQTLRPIWSALAGRGLPLFELDADGTRAMAEMLLPRLRSLDMEYLAWDEDAMGFILESLRRRAMWGLPKLDYLSIAFFEGMENRQKVRDEINRALPYYEENVKSFASTFEWGWT